MIEGGPGLVAWKDFDSIRAWLLNGREGRTDCAVDKARGVDILLPLWWMSLPMPMPFVKTFLFFLPSCNVQWGEEGRARVSVRAGSRLVDCWG